LDDDCRLLAGSKPKYGQSHQAIRHQINLVARALAGRDDLVQILQEITQGLDRCRIDKRRKHPTTFQLLLDPTLLQTDLLLSRGAGGP